MHNREATRQLPARAAVSAAAKRARARIPGDEAVDDSGNVVPDAKFPSGLVPAFLVTELIGGYSRPIIITFPSGLVPAFLVTLRVRAGATETRATVSKRARARIPRYWTNAPIMMVAA